MAGWRGAAVFGIALAGFFVEAVAADEVAPPPDLTSPGLPTATPTSPAPPINKPRPKPGRVVVGGIGTAPAPKGKPKSTPKFGPLEGVTVGGIGTAPAPKPKPVPKPEPREIAALVFPEIWSGPFLEGKVGYGSNNQLYGGLADLDVGFNVQLGRSVFGLSGGVDTLWAHNSSPTQWSAFTMVRYGYAISDRLLPYVAIGPEVADIGSAAGLGAATGWKFSAGLAYRINQSWSVEAEFSHADLPDMPQTDHIHRFYNDEIRVGLQYFLPTGVAPR